MKRTRGGEGAEETPKLAYVTRLRVMYIATGVQFSHFFKFNFEFIKLFLACINYPFSIIPSIKK